MRLWLKYEVFSNNKLLVYVINTYYIKSQISDNQHFMIFAPYNQKRLLF